MANFAKAQLLKYGWTEGKGLGKNEDGIKEAIRPTLKFDTQGIGHKSSESDHWWEHAFNKAAKNISVKSQSDGVSISLINENSDDMKKPKDKNVTQPYKNFQKTSTLCNGHLIHEIKMHEDKEPPKEYFSVLTDEELFKACGGRTAHKGARHGLTQNGKLERIARQERILLGIENDDATFKRSSCFENTKGCDNTNGRSMEIQDNDSGIDSNGNNVSPPANSSREHSEEFVKSRKLQKRERKHINSLANQLSKSCSITENLVLHDSTCNDGKELRQKRKRSKSKRSNTSETNMEDLVYEENTDYDMLLEKQNSYENAAKRKRLDKCFVHDEIKNDMPKCKHLTNCCKKKKKSKKANRDTEDKCKYSLEMEDDVHVNEKKITKHSKVKSRSLEDLHSIENANANVTLEKIQKKKDHICDAEHILADLKKFMKHDKEKCLNKQEVVHEEKRETLVDENSTARQAHLLNYRIRKRKFKKIGRARLRKLTLDIAKNHGSEECGAVNCIKKCKKSKTEKKLETIMQDLMAVSLTEDVSEIIKKKKKKDHESKA